MDPTHIRILNKDLFYESSPYVNPTPSLNMALFSYILTRRPHKEGYGNIEANKTKSTILRSF